MRAVRAAGGTPFVEVRHTRVTRELLLKMTGRQAALARDLELRRMKKMQVYIAIRGSENASENSDVPADRMALYSRITRPVMDYRVNHTRWCVLRWPTPSMAQAAGMSTEAFENLYFDVCTMNYAKMARAMVPLERRMKRADRVQLKSPGTDLTFSLKGIGAKMCKGDRNIPDGEVFSCPVKNSVNGVIQFNTPTIYAGTKFENIRLEFKDGKVIKAAAKQHQAAERNPGHRRGRALRGRIFTWVQSLHFESDVRHFVRREDRRFAALHPRPGLRGMRQRQPLGGALGHGADPASGMGRRRSVVRR